MGIVNGEAELHTKTNAHSHAKLSFLAATMFIAGEVAGSGVLALPYAMKGAGWSGIALAIICCLASGQAAVYLARSWCIVEERWPEYTAMQSDPYAVIGLKAFGRKAQIATTIGVFVQCYGGSIVVLSICSDLVHSCAENIHGLSELTSCEWIIIIGLLAIPFMWLPSPAEITFVAYTALLSTTVSCGLMMAIFGQELVAKHGSSEAIKVEPQSFFLAMSTMSFAFGGAAAFPTFQNFMEDKSKFPHAIVASFTLLMILFIPISVTGFVLYAGALKENIMDNLPNSPMKTTIQVLMALHVFAALLILINPINLSLEKSVGITGTGINWKRCFVRSVVGLSLIGVILTVPSFSMVLNLIGATSVAVTSYIFPTVFYWGLTRQTKDTWIDRRLSVSTKIVCFLICAFGVIGGVAGTYCAVEKITTFAKPCYI